MTFAQWLEARIDALRVEYGCTRGEARATMGERADSDFYKYVVQCVKAGEVCTSRVLDYICSTPHSWNRLASDCRDYNYLPPGYLPRWVR